MAIAGFDLATFGISNDKFGVGGYDDYGRMDIAFRCLSNGNWARIGPMLQFPAEVRQAIYTTDVIESLNFSLRKIMKTRAAFLSEEASLKIEVW